MFALVVDGLVMGVRRTPREVSTGSWLPLIEDEATHSPYGEQVVSGFTVENKQVIRHWKQQPTVQSRFTSVEKEQESQQDVLETLILTMLEVPNV